MYQRYIIFIFLYIVFDFYFDIQKNNLSHIHFILPFIIILPIMEKILHLIFAFKSPSHK